MMRVIHIAIAVIAIVGIAAVATVVAQGDTVEEKSTGKLFPKTISFAGEYKTFNLEVTGVGLRKKYWAKVYGMAHYMEGGQKYENKDAALTAALSDQYAKQITMIFVRDVDAEKIQNSFRDGFKKNASESEMNEISIMVEQFAGYFFDDIKKGHKFVFQVAPGGRVNTIIHGEEQGPIDSVTFARVLWRIWLGKHSPVDRNRLVEMIVED
jgi:hypothetical protein